MSDADNEPLSTKELLTDGRQLLGMLEAMSHDEMSKSVLELVDGATHHNALCALVYAAVTDGKSQASPGRERTSGAATAALGVAAGMSGHTSTLYKAARMSADVRAVEKSVQTGDPKYAARRAKNVLVGRSIGKAGVWKKLWK